jgi:light-regulated signal transduction histidine kinase (bacteriophytochrome)
LRAGNREISLLLTDYWQSMRLLVAFAISFAILSWLFYGTVLRQRQRTISANQKLALEVEERRVAQLLLEERTEELERSNRDLDQFAAVASHDLHQPLQSVAGFCHLLREHYRDQVDENGRRYLQLAAEGAGRMQRLLQDLLHYSRVGQRREPLEEVNVDDVVLDVQHNLEAAIREKQAVITQAPLPSIHARRGQLTQVFQNLIENSLKYHGSDPPIVQVGAEPSSRGWIFTVRDEGPGIAPEMRERVFLLFQRGADVEDLPGSGLGLALCRRILELQGGRIWIDDRQQSGAAVQFEIPSSVGRQVHSDPAGATAG